MVKANNTKNIASVLFKWLQNPKKEQEKRERKMYVRAMGTSVRPELLQAYRKRFASDRGSFDILVVSSIVVGCLALLGLTGCGATSRVGEGISISATPDGMRAFADMMVGAAKTAKESPDANNQFLGFRAHQESEKTVRETQPSFLSNLFKGSNNDEGVK